MAKRRTIDIRIDNHGSFCLLHAETKRALQWLEENCADDAQWWSFAIVCEPRYVADIVQGAHEDGLEVA